MSSGLVITIVFGILGANVASMTLVAKLLGDRIGDLAGRVDRLETRGDERHNVYIAKFDGLAETVARFDERVKGLERRS